MEENKAQTTQEEIAGGAVAGTETSEAVGTATESEEIVSTEVFEDTGAKEAPTEKPKQSAEENRAQAQRRREREALISDVRTKAIIETLGGKNPWSGEEMKDAADVEEYLIMKQIEKDGGDPLADFSKYRKKQDREAAEKTRKEAETREWYESDRKAFIEKHPDVELRKLLSDERFRDYAEGKVGRRPLTEIYEGYRSFVGKTDEKAREIAAQAIANKQASPGVLATSGEAESDYFAPEEVRKMSPADVRKNYEKIRASMAKW